MRASVHINEIDGTTSGWLTDFDVLPRIGEEVRLRNGSGEIVGSGTVLGVRHLLWAQTDYRAGAQMIEIDVGEITDPLGAPCAREPLAPPKSTQESGS